MVWGDYLANSAEEVGAGRSRTVTVGWTLHGERSNLIYSPPRAFDRGAPKPASAKSVQVCPAAVDFDRRHFVVTCPYDLTLKIDRTPDGKLSLQDADGMQSAMRPAGSRNVLTLHPPAEWRHPERPIIQLAAPWIFVADEVCYLVQTPPYLDYFPTPRPGVQIGGRFPVHVWPRPLSWGFEWHDISRPLVLKRGEPWFYVHFETENPAARVRLVEAERTGELDEFVTSILDVTNYVNRTFSLFDEARRRRPEKLLRAKKE